MENINYYPLTATENYPLPAMENINYYPLWKALSPTIQHYLWNEYFTITFKFKLIFLQIILQKLDKASFK